MTDTRLSRSKKQQSPARFRRNLDFTGAATARFIAGSCGADKSSILKRMVGAHGIEPWTSPVCRAGLDLIFQGLSFSFSRVTYSPLLLAPFFERQQVRMSRRAAWF